MEAEGLEAGLAALAFWGFVAVLVYAAVNHSIRERETRHETLRRIIESGQKIDQPLLDQILAALGGGNKRVDRSYKLAAMIALPVSIGMFGFAALMGSQYGEALLPLLAVGFIMFCFAIGLLIASRVAQRWYEP